MKGNINYILAYTTKGKFVGMFTGYTEGGKATDLEPSYIFKIIHGKSNVNQCKGYTFHGVDVIPTEEQIKSIGRDVKVYFEIINSSLQIYLKKNNIKTKL